MLTFIYFSLSGKIEVGPDFRKLAICFKYGRETHSQYVVVLVHPVGSAIIVRSGFEGSGAIINGADFIQPFVGNAVRVFQAFFKRSIERTMIGGVGGRGGVVVGLRRGWCAIGEVIGGHVLVGGKGRKMDGH